MPILGGSVGGAKSSPKTPYFPLCETVVELAQAKYHKGRGGANWIVNGKILAASVPLPMPPAKPGDPPGPVIGTVCGWVQKLDGTPDQMSAGAGACKDFAGVLLGFRQGDDAGLRAKLRPIWEPLIANGEARKEFVAREQREPTAAELETNAYGLAVDAVLVRASGPENPHRGQKLSLVVSNIITKGRGTNFSLHTWAPFVPGTLGVS